MSEAILSSQSLNSSSEYEDIGIFYNDNSGGYGVAAIAVPIDRLANYKELCVHTKFLQNINVLNVGSYSDGYIKIFGVQVEHHAKGATLPQSTEIYPIFANVYILNDLYSSKKYVKYSLYLILNHMIHL